MMSNRMISVAALVMWAVLFAPITIADDITDSINEGLKYYNEGQYSEAATSLNYASQLIQQKKGGSLAAYLPEPLGGWTAQQAEAETSGAAFGAGISAAREYQKDSRLVNIQIVADSPMLQGVTMMFSNPIFAQSDGGKLTRISGQKAMIKYDVTSNNGEIKIVVANRILVTIEGNSVPQTDLTAYAEAIDYKKLATLP